jgi:transcriptional regulator with XRE-family HTH domain
MANSKAPAESTFEVRSVIEKLGVSQHGLSRLMGKSLDWVGRIVRGHFSPSWPNAAAIARSLNVSVGVFLEGDPAREDFFAEYAAEQTAASAKTPNAKKEVKKVTSKKRGSQKGNPVN